MKKILFLLLLPFACYSQNSTNLPSGINEFNIESIRGTDQDLETLFFVGKHHNYRDSAEYVTIKFDSLDRTFNFYLKKELVAYYKFSNKDKNLITDHLFDVQFHSARFPEHHYKFNIEKINGNLFIITIKNWGFDYRLVYGDVIITARLTSGVLSLQQNTGSSSSKPPLLSLAQRKKLFSF